MPFVNCCKITVHTNEKLRLEKASCRRKKHSGMLRSFMSFQLEVRFLGYTADKGLSIPQQASVPSVLLSLHLRYGLQSGDVFLRRGVPPPLDYYCGSSSTLYTLTCLICAIAVILIRFKSSDLLKMGRSLHAMTFDSVILSGATE